MSERAFSFRVIFMSLMVGVGAGAVAGMIWPGSTATVTWLVAGFIYIGTIRGTQMIRCPRCMSRVKIGADTCRRCRWTQP